MIRLRIVLDPIARPSPPQDVWGNLYQAAADASCVVVQDTREFTEHIRRAAGAIRLLSSIPPLSIDISGTIADEGLNAMLGLPPER